MSQNAGDPFIVTTDEASGARRIEHACGEGPPVLVKEDLTDPLFCSFLSWASHNPAKAGWIACGPAAEYLCDVRSVEAFCLANLIILAAKPSDGSAFRLKTENPPNHTISYGHFYDLQRAVARPNNVFPSHTDGGLFYEPAGIRVHQSVLEKLNQELESESSALRRMSTWPIRRAFTYIDVSDFSKFPSGQQMLVINSIVGLVADEANWLGLGRFGKDGLEAMMCIGDGYIFVFKDSLSATAFAAHLAYMIEVFVAKRSLPVPFHFRMGVHVGEVYCFHDPGRDDWNYIGDGINGGQRVLGAIGKETDDVVFISGQVREELLARETARHPTREILSNLHNRGRRSDKHGNPWRVYELNHSDLVPQFSSNLS